MLYQTWKDNILYLYNSIPTSANFEELKIDTIQCFGQTISMSIVQPKLKWIKGGQSYFGGGQKRVRARYIPTEHPTYRLGFFWQQYKF